MRAALGAIALAAIALAPIISATACGGQGGSRTRDEAPDDAATEVAAAGEAVGGTETGGTKTGGAGREDADTREPEAGGADSESAGGGDATGEAGEAALFESERARVYFPSGDGQVLVGETRTVFRTPRPGDRAKQIVNALIEGPQTGGSSRAVPEGTQLRQLFVLADGTAWVDFSAELRDNLPGGSAGELLAVYAIVDSIALNVPEISRVGILVEGRPVESLSGHVDLRRALPVRRDLLAVAAAPAN